MRYILKFAIPATSRRSNAMRSQHQPVAACSSSRRQRCADPEMLRPHHSANSDHISANWGHWELGAQSGRKNQPACRPVCLSVCRCVGLSHYSEPCKTVGPIEMPFGLRNSGGPKEPCIRWGPDPPCKGAILRGASHRKV